MTHRTDRSVDALASLFARSCVVGRYQLRSEKPCLAGVVVAELRVPLQSTRYVLAVRIAHAQRLPTALELFDACNAAANTIRGAVLNWCQYSYIEDGTVFMLDEDTWLELEGMH
jgi:hypothetical protein